MTTRRPLPSDRYDDGVFRLGRDAGLLPRAPPLERLPGRFDALQAILDELPVVVDPERGRAGLLGRPEAVAVAAETLPDFDAEIAALHPGDPEDVPVVVALFRGYAFLACAYVLEPALRGRAVAAALPPHLARPLVHLADLLGRPPWLDEHHAWSLHDWALIDPDRAADERLRWDNLRACVRLTGSDAELALTRAHVHVAAHTPPLIGSVVDALGAARRIAAGEGAFDALADALHEQLDALTSVHAALVEARRAAQGCPPDPHLDVFRAGCQGHLLGAGVIFEGVDRFGGRPWRPGPPSSTLDHVLAVIDALTRSGPPGAPVPTTPAALGWFLADVGAEVEALDLPAMIQSDAPCAALLQRVLAAAQGLRGEPRSRPLGEAARDRVIRGASPGLPVA